MKRLNLLLPVAILLSVVVGVALAAQHYTGWILDQKDAMAGVIEGDHSHHITADNPAVFLNEPDRRIYNVKNAPRLETLVGKKVAIEGDVFRDTITVKSMKEIPRSPALGQ